MKRLEVDTGSRKFEINLSNMDFPNLKSDKYNFGDNGYVDVLIPKFINADGDEFIYWDTGLVDSVSAKGAVFVQSAGTTLDGQCANFDDPLSVNIQVINGSAIGTETLGGYLVGTVDFYCSFIHSYIQGKAHICVVDGIDEYDSNVYHGDVSG